jgi:hypothetical protein
MIRALWQWIGNTRSAAMGLMDLARPGVIALPYYGIEWMEIEGSPVLGLPKEQVEQYAARQRTELHRLQLGRDVARARARELPR